MDEEYNPFQSPEAPAPTPSYLVPQSLYGGKRIVPFASGHVRAMFAMSLLAAVVVVDLLGCWACVSQNELLDAIMQGQHPAQSALEANDQLFKSIAIGCALANIGTIIPFLMWTHRVYRNLPALGARKPESSPGMAVGWYFIPFANLVMPCKLMLETWRYSDPAQHGQLRKTASSLVGIWWGAFVIRNVVSQYSSISASAENARPTLESLKALTSTSLVAFTIEIIAAFLAAFMIFSIDKNQQATHDLIAAQPPSEPTSDPYYG